MAISAYVGLPGSGKSHGVVRDVIVPAIQAGRRVWTNIPLHLEEWQSRYGAQPVVFPIADIERDPRWFQDVFEPGAVLVLDEVWRLWPSGLKANNAIEGHKSFLAEHRHMVGGDGRSTEVVLVTQDLSQLAQFARSLIDTTYKFTKLDKLGAKGAYTLNIYQGAALGQKVPDAQRLRTIPGKYDPAIFTLYQSHTMSATGEAGDETRADQRFNVLKGVKAKAFVATMILGPILAFMGLRSVWQKYQNPHGDAPPVTVAAPAAPAPVPVQRLALPFDQAKMHIIFNRQDARGIQYVFRVEAGDGLYADVTTLELMELGYWVQPVNQCLAQLVAHGQLVRLVYCRQPERDEGLLAGAGQVLAAN